MDNNFHHQSIAESVCYAATLISTPGTIGYVALIIWLQVNQVDLSHNLVVPIMLASTGLAVFLLACLGLTAGLMVKFRSRISQPLPTICVWINGLALVAFIALILLTPQFE